MAMHPSPVLTSLHISVNGNTTLPQIGDFISADQPFGLSVVEYVLEIVSEMTQRQDTQETDTTLAGGKITVQASKLVVYIYIAPPGRIPDSMTKPFQYSACA